MPMHACPFRQFSTIAAFVGMYLSKAWGKLAELNSTDKSSLPLQDLLISGRIGLQQWHTELL